MNKLTGISEVEVVLGVVHAFVVLVPFVCVRVVIILHQQAEEDDEDDLEDDAHQG